MLFLLFYWGAETAGSVAGSRAFGGWAVERGVWRVAGRLDEKPISITDVRLGEKRGGCIESARRHRRADRADRGNSAEPFPGAVLVALCQQFLPNFLAQCSQRIKLLEVERGPETHTWFADLAEPSHPVQP